MQQSQTPVRPDQNNCASGTMTPASTAAPASSTRWKRVLREPLVHFLVIGLVLFISYRAMHPEAESPDQSRQIVLTEDDLFQISAAWLAQGRPAPTADQMQSLIEAKVREEVLCREGLALGLDKDDTIVKRRLAQKMEFLAEDMSNLAEPSPQELKSWFESNRERFALQPRISFRHLYFSPDQRGEKAQQAAAGALETLGGKPAEAPEAAALADPFMLQDIYADRSFGQVATSFGPQFAGALFQMKPGSWQGPVESGYGWHLVFISALEASRVPAFEEVEADVKSEWINDQRMQAKRKAYEAMKARYQVVLPAATEKQAGFTFPHRP